MFRSLIKVPIIAAVLLLVAWGLSFLVPSLTVLKLLHVLAAILLGGGLLGVLMSDLRARAAKSLTLLVDSIEAMLGFYYRLVVPGSLLILLSGFSMVFSYYGWAALEIPWLAGMLVLFVFEFLEGHLIMKFHYLKLRKGVEAAKAADGSPEALEEELRARLTTATHFLDVPNFTLIVILGMVRPADWTLFSIGVPIVIALTAWMTYALPRRRPWQAFATPAPAARAA